MNLTLPMPSPSPTVTAAMAGLALAMAALFCLAVRRVRPAWTARTVAATLAWLGATAALAGSGLLADFDARPPRFLVLLAAALALALALGLSRLGAALAELPLWLLVLAQSFRLPLELIIHAAAREGTAPSVMTWSGRNFDVVSGALALVVGLALRLGAPRALAWLFWPVGALLLGNVLAVAVLSSPLVAHFGPTQLNVWVVHPPFVWLPTVLVVLALAGQIVIVRALGRR